MSTLNFDFKPAYATKPMIPESDYGYQNGALSFTYPTPTYTVPTGKYARVQGYLFHGNLSIDGSNVYVLDNAGGGVIQGSHTGLTSEVLMMTCPNLGTAMRCAYYGDPAGSGVEYRIRRNGSLIIQNYQTGTAYNLWNAYPGDALYTIRTAGSPVSHSVFALYPSGGTFANNIPIDIWLKEGQTVGLAATGSSGAVANFNLSVTEYEG